MTRSQQYIDLLLDHIPKWELKEYEHRDIFDRVKEAIVTSDDVRTKLIQLYKVKGFSDFALSLLWIVDRVEQDAALEHPTQEEENLVFSFFRKAVGESESSVPKQSANDADVISSQSENATFSFTSDEAVPDITPEYPDWGVSLQSDAFQPNTGMNEEGFAHLLEQFLESVQSGNDDRETLLKGLKLQCTEMLSNATDQEAQRFYQLLDEFLEYVDSNQYIDDIRVMNIISNIQDPYAQWAHSPLNERSGKLDPANAILQDFKSMFE
jgi:hypothetical protein